MFHVCVTWLFTFFSPPLFEWKPKGRVTFPKLKNNIILLDATLTIMLISKKKTCKLTDWQNCLFLFLTQIVDLQLVRWMFDCEDTWRRFVLIHKQWPLPETAASSSSFWFQYYLQIEPVAVCVLFVCLMQSFICEWMRSVVLFSVLFFIYGSSQQAGDQRRNQDKIQVEKVEIIFPSNVQLVFFSCHCSPLWI